MAQEEEELVLETKELEVQKNNATVDVVNMFKEAGAHRLADMLIEKYGVAENYEVA